jgi:hypothetical protein
MVLNRRVSREGRTGLQDIPLTHGFITGSFVRIVLVHVAPIAATYRVMQKS